MIQTRRPAVLLRVIPLCTSRSFIWHVPQKESSESSELEEVSDTDILLPFLVSILLPLLIIRGDTPIP